MDSGWIKMHRKFLEWEWYEDINTKVLFIHCLLKANHKSKKWKGNLIKRGTFITSINHLSDETGLSSQNVRTSLSKLQSTGEINKVSTSVNTCITIINYDDYQDTNKPLTNDQQSTNKRLTTTKNEKNVRMKESMYAFDLFWEMYGNKKDRKKCEIKWDKISEKEREEIIKFIPIYKDSEPNEQYRKYPYTFLNSEIWKDDWKEYKNENKLKTEYYI